MEEKHRQEFNAKTNELRIKFEQSTLRIEELEQEKIENSKKIDMLEEELHKNKTKMNRLNIQNKNQVRTIRHLRTQSIVTSNLNKEQDTIIKEFNDKKEQDLDFLKRFFLRKKSQEFNFDLETDIKFNLSLYKDRDAMLALSLHKPPAIRQFSLENLKSGDTSQKDLLANSYPESMQRFNLNQTKSRNLFKIEQNINELVQWFKVTKETTHINKCEITPNCLNEILKSCSQCKELTIESSKIVVSEESEDFDFESGIDSDYKIEKLCIINSIDEDLSLETQRNVATKILMAVCNSSLIDTLKEIKIYNNGKSYFTQEITLDALVAMSEGESATKVPGILKKVLERLKPVAEDIEERSETADSSSNYSD